MARWINITRETTMVVPASIDFWSDLDADVLRCLAEQPGEMTPADLGRRLGMSESAVCSILAMLAETGKIRICSVELEASGSNAGPDSGADRAFIAV
jgi:DNA-binding Lrp family transcriptional regulator